MFSFPLYEKGKGLKNFSYAILRIDQKGESARVPHFMFPYSRFPYFVFLELRKNLIAKNEIFSKLRPEKSVEDSD
jgi:hypothetical protein